ncbi:hypothetical protein HAX54_003698 [Datura stramonium]|uniref:Uncharacterized protein n=1 Tax=Datura stramonium TaxID=4076 RepID=A0ABS8RV65_DATST|nr:hypothetical protein [Datura stramonium]
MGCKVDDIYGYPDEMGDYPPQSQNTPYREYIHMQCAEENYINSRQEGRSTHCSTVTTWSGKVFHSEPKKHIGEKIIDKDEVGPEHIAINEEVLVRKSMEREAKDKVIEVSCLS